MKKFLVTLIIICALWISCSDSNPQHIIAPGIIDAEIITLKSLVAGTITSINIKEGSTIKQGDVLLHVNKDKIANQLEELAINQKEILVNRIKLLKKQQLMKSMVSYWRRQVERFKRLKAKKSISGEKLESMKLKLMEAETSELEIQKSIESLSIQEEKLKVKEKYLNLLLKDHLIAAPISGVILEKFVSKGENLFPNTPIVDIMDTSSLHVEIFIEEKEMASLHIGQKVQIMVDGIEKQKLTGTIAYFGRKAEFTPKYIISEKERKSLLYQVHISIKNNIQVFKVGMPVTVILKRQQ